MKLINQHKGKKNFVTEFNGIESHSSLIDNGVNSIMYCMQFIIEFTPLSIGEECDSIPLNSFTKFSLYC